MMCQCPTFTFLTQRGTHFTTFLICAWSLPVFEFTPLISFWLISRKKQKKNRIYGNFNRGKGKWQCRTWNHRHIAILRVKYVVSTSYMSLYNTMSRCPDLGSVTVLVYPALRVNNLKEIKQEIRRIRSVSCLISRLIYLMVNKHIKGTLRNLNFKEVY